MKQIGVRNRSESDAEFGLILGTDLAPFWLPFGSLWSTPNPPESCSGGLLGSHWRSQISPRPLFGLFWAPLGPRERICDPFWPLQGPSSTPEEADFEPSAPHSRPPGSMFDETFIGVRRPFLPAQFGTLGPSQCVKIQF